MVLFVNIVNPFYVLRPKIRYSASYRVMYSTPLYRYQTAVILPCCSVIFLPNNLSFSMNQKLGLKVFLLGNWKYCSFISSSTNAL